MHIVAVEDCCEIDVYLFSFDQCDTEAKMKECSEYIEQVKETLQNDVEQLRGTLSEMFSQNAAVKSQLFLCKLVHLQSLIILESFLHSKVQK